MELYMNAARLFERQFEQLLLFLAAVAEAVATYSVHEGTRRYKNDHPCHIEKQAVCSEQLDMPKFKPCGAMSTFEIRCGALRQRSLVAVKVIHEFGCHA
eukprot:1161994-Pelagomonas_calceolata.AAC.9